MNTENFIESIDGIDYYEKTIVRKYGIKQEPVQQVPQDIVDAFTELGFSQVGSYHSIQESLNTNCPIQYLELHGQFLRNDYEVLLKYTSKPDWNTGIIIFKAKEGIATNECIDAGFPYTVKTGLERLKVLINK